jgi:hypothetical protein
VNLHDVFVTPFTSSEQIAYLNMPLEAIRCSGVKRDRKRLCPRGSVNYRLRNTVIPVAEVFGMYAVHV